MDTSKDVIVDLTFAFALNIIDYTETLEIKKKYNLANQLFKAGTSIGANVNEAQCSESRADFIHKMKIAAKEAEETKYWLQLCLRAKSYPDPGDLLVKIQSIIKILTKIITTSKSVKAQEPAHLHIDKSPH
jgi:four helix bundle protein